MPQGVDAASFEFYEGIRIFIPGAAAVTLTAAVDKTFDGPLKVSGNEIPALVAALAVGLVFYFVDAPAKAAINKPLQPTEYLKSWGKKSPRGVSLLNAYLLMLDTEIPAAIRARALYMGSMFRIGFEVIYLLLLTSCGVLLSSCFQDHAGRDRLDWSGQRIAFASGVVLIWLYVFRREILMPRKRKREKARKAAAAGQPAPVDRPPLAWDPRPVKFDWLDASIVAAASFSLAVLLSIRDEILAWPLAIPALALLGLWATRYFRGYQRKPIEMAVAMDGLHACSVAGAAVSLVLFSQTATNSRLTSSQEALWSGAALLALVMLAARGHERRLRGCYSSQNTWLGENKQRMIDQYFAPAPAPAPAPALSPRPAPSPPSGAQP